MKISQTFKVLAKGIFLFEVKSRKYLFIFLSIYLLLIHSPIYAQEKSIPAIRFKDADINLVIQSIAQKAIKDGKKVNIVTRPSVKGSVSINLENVGWETALKVIMDAHNYGYEWIGDNIILVSTLEEIKEREAQEKKRQEVEVPRTKVFKLIYLDANDAKKAVEPILSLAGRASVLEITGQTGWEFGTDVTKRKRVKEGIFSRTKVLLISDIAKKLNEIETLLEEIDVMPMQVLIKTRIMEVNRDLLKDIGFDWGTGSTGASSETLSFTNLDEKGKKAVAGHILGDQVTPSGFGPKTTALTTGNTGFRLGFRKLTGFEFEALLHALEEDTRTNTLSAPSILTINNQEASILVGQKFPIVRTTTSTETNRIIGGELDFYQDIGIQLNVIPQIAGDNDEFVNMIIHPAITSRLSDVTVTDQEGTTLATFPLLSSREAETQTIIKDGETIVMGGLLKDVVIKQEIGVPFLRKLSLIGRLFRRNTYDTEKIDLLIFITAKIIKPGEKIPQEIIDKSSVTSEFEKKEEKKQN
ncbi:MAG: general secretion pathway protein D [Candidatus Scalindua rubra]|uniref:General secretion pathway protein D n=1 Tax=Candidatus Scalindua rubra TaxID=1872076 RepID=A0A1E3X491_9BACT|nr:MAG: general secretion pathway protein D [Candidatus Scalindua rubra]